MFDSQRHNSIHKISKKFRILNQNRYEWKSAQSTGKLIEENLIDYVALDFKGPKEKFFAITKADFYTQFLSCFELLQASSIPFEVRTTYHSSLLNLEDIVAMQDVLLELGYDKNYYIQNFRNYQNTIAPLPDSQSISEKDIHQNMTKIIFR